jgi:sugar phosphate permease
VLTTTSVPPAAFSAGISAARVSRGTAAFTAKARALEDAGDLVLAPGVRHATALILGLLGVVLIAFPLLARLGTAGMVAGITLSGLLLYGPYSLLSGALAVDLEGKERAATVACLVDAVGYLAGVLAGTGFGKLVDALGYGSGFGVLGGMMLVSGVLCLGLFRGQPRSVQSAS